jgi:hypothetical protein
MNDTNSCRDFKFCTSMLFDPRGVTAASISTVRSSAYGSPATEGCIESVVSHNTRAGSNCGACGGALRRSSKRKDRIYSRPTSNDATIINRTDEAALACLGESRTRSIVSGTPFSCSPLS